MLHLKNNLKNSRNRLFIKMFRFKINQNYDCIKKDIKKKYLSRLKFKKIPGVSIARINHEIIAGGLLKN